MEPPLPVADESVTTDAALVEEQSAELKRVQKRKCH